MEPIVKGLIWGMAVMAAVIALIVCVVLVASSWAVETLPTCRPSDLLVGGAGECTPVATDLPGSQTVWMPAGVKPDGTVAPIILDREGYVQLNPCLEKMEAAMRAMEPWTFTGWNLGNANMFRVYLEMNRDQWAKYEQVQKQWADTKRQCWRQP